MQYKKQYTKASSTEGGEDKTLSLVPFHETESYIRQRGTRWCPHHAGPTRVQRPQVGGGMLGSAGQ